MSGMWERERNLKMEEEKEEEEEEGSEIYADHASISRSRRSCRLI